MAKTSSETAQAVKAPFLKAYHELFDSDDLWAAARKLGVVTRERKVDVPALVEAAVLAMSGLPGTQTTIFANYLQLMGEAIAPSSFYGRFTVPFAGLMADVSGRAIEAVRALAPEDRENEEVAALLRHFTDVQITDSTCKLLQKLAQDWGAIDKPRSGRRPSSSTRSSHSRTAFLLSSISHHSATTIARNSTNLRSAKGRYSWAIWATSTKSAWYGSSGAMSTS